VLAFTIDKLRVKKLDTMYAKIYAMLIMMLKVTIECALWLTVFHLLTVTSNSLHCTSTCRLLLFRLSRTTAGSPFVLSSPTHYVLIDILIEYIEVNPNYTNTAQSKIHLYIRFIPEGVAEAS
jgi:hypothetical protein